MHDTREPGQTIAHHARTLRGIPAGITSRRPAAGAWSCREILGHLIDSAVNNLPRFIEAQGRSDLVFSGYDQDAWVVAQGWNSRDWSVLVELWAGLNRQVVAVMAGTPVQERIRERHPHSLHLIAWQPVPADRPVTLEYLMTDYLGHLEHHLAVLYCQANATGNRRLDTD